MKYLVAGLGNIGNEYNQTRHNIGFSVVEYIAYRKEEAFVSDRLAYVSKIKIKGRVVLLIKPTTYMNLSGKAVRYWLEQEKIPISNCLIITDDLSLPLGKIRMRAQGSSGGHNGLSNISEILNTDSYPRLRFGIGSNYPKGMQVDFVLGKWNKEEESLVSQGVEKSALAVETFVLAGINQAMNLFNK